MILTTAVGTTPEEIGYAIGRDATFDEALGVIKAIDDSMVVIEFTQAIYDYAKAILRENGVNPETGEEV